MHLPNINGEKDFAKDPTIMESVPVGGCKVFVGVCGFINDLHYRGIFFYSDSPT